MIENDPFMNLHVVQEFTKKVAQTFHNKQHGSFLSPPSLITTGSASWKWSSDKTDENISNQLSKQPPPLSSSNVVGDWWKDCELDFYSIHFYPWMLPKEEETELENNFDVYGKGFTPSFYHYYNTEEEDEKRLIFIGETISKPFYDPNSFDILVPYSHQKEESDQLKEEDHQISRSTVEEDGRWLTTCLMLEYALKNEYDGVFFWSDMGKDGAGSWVNIKHGIECFLDTRG